TGRPAIAGKTLTAVLRAVAEYHPPAPRDLNPSVPAPLSELIMRLLAKRPAGRPASARAVAEELAALGDRPPARPAHRSRRAALAAAGAVVALAAAVGAWLLTRQPAPG